MQTGGSGVLFGSDINHGQCVTIRICRADLTRNLSNDWIHPNSTPIVEVQMSHAQFAEFITSNGQYAGTPCTIGYAPAVGTPTEMMPSIDRLETKAETFRREIKDSTRNQLNKMKADVDAMGAELEKGSISKKTLKELHRNLQILMGNMPSNMAFTVEQAEEALEKAQTHAKIEIEAYITNAINKLGLEAAKKIGLVQEGATPVLIPHDIKGD